MARRIATHDWVSTPLGPVAGWSPGLRTVVDLMLETAQPVCIGWGAEPIALYNDSFMPILGTEHPACLGRPFREGWAESWNDLEPLIAAVMAGEAQDRAGRDQSAAGATDRSTTRQSLSFTPLRAQDGSVGGFYCVATERPQADHVLRESEARHRLLVETWTQANWETDAEGVVVNDSPSWRAYTGQTLDQWLGYGWLDAVHPDDRAYAERQWREAMAARRFVDAEFRLRAPDGSWRWTNVRAAPVLDADGRIEKWLGTNVDIDARRGAEAARREREADMMRVQRIGRVGGLDIDVTGGLVSRRSPEYLRLHGLGPESLYETHADWRARVHADDVDEAERRLFAAMAGSEDSFDQEYRIVRPSDGAIRWIHARVDILRDDMGKATRLVGAHLDVTDQKRMQEDLRASEERQAFLLKLSDTLRAEPDDLIVDRAIEMLVDELKLDLCYVVIVLSSEDRADVVHQLRRRSDMPELPAAIRLSDYPQAFSEWQERTLVSEDMAHDPSLTDIDRRNVAAMRFGALIAAPVRRGAGNPIWSIVAVMRGPRRWTPHEIALVEETAERTWAAIERARTEAAIRASEERQAFLLKLSDALRPLNDSAELERTAVQMLGRELGADRVFYATMDDGDASWSVAHDHHDGLPSIAGRYSLSGFQDSRLEQWRAGRMSSIADSEATPALNADERAAYAAFGARAAIGVPLVTGDRFAALLVVNQAEPRDWTPAELALTQETAERTWTAIERARAEAALRESEQRLRTLADTAPALIWFNDQDGGNTFVNRVFVDYTGRTLEQIAGEGWHGLVDPAHEARYVAGYVDAVRAQRPWQDRNRLRRADGEWHWFENHAQPLFAPDGRYLGHVGVSIDVTEVVEAEQALRSSEERFRALAVAGGASIYRMSADWRLMYQLDSDTLATTPEPIADWVAKYIPPDDLPAVRAAIDTAIRTKSLFELEHRVWAADGEIAWVLSRAVPLLGDDGEIVEWFGAGTVVTARKQAEEALRDSEERYRTLFESMDEAYAVVEVLKDDAGRWCDFRFLDANPAFIVHTNMPYPVGRTATELLGTPNPRWTELYGQALDTGRTLRVEETEPTLGITFDLNIFVLDRANNRVAVLFTNITDRKRAEAALRDSERRQQMLIDGVPQLIWRAVNGGHWTWASPQWTDFTGQAESDSHGRGWLDAVHPDDREDVRDIWQTAMARGEFQADYRICHATERRYRWFQTRATPVRDDEGKVVEWLGTSTDVDDLRSLQDRQQVLVAELQHRTRNLMGVVRSTANRTGETSVDFADFRRRFHDRLEALARVQGLLSRLEEADRITFDELIRTELTAMNGDAGRVTLDGPDGIRLRSSMVQTLAMALHELATNAVKYGALGQADGRLTVTWRMIEPDPRGRPRLRIDWRESGVTMPPPAAAPQGGGQGRELIERALP